MNDEMQRILNQKSEELERAIEKFRIENEKVDKLKKEYETVLKKTKIDLRDQDLKKKKEAEDFEKAKEEEL